MHNAWQTFCIFNKLNLQPRKQNNGLYERKNGQMKKKKKTSRYDKRLTKNIQKRRNLLLIINSVWDKPNRYLERALCFEVFEEGCCTLDLTLQRRRNHV